MVTLALALVVSLAAGPAPVELSSACPPGFSLRGGRCFLQSPYRAYPSLQGAGVGGLKTGLPRLREGFTPQQIDLGRYLFFDPLLSSSRTVACASCHRPELGFSDGRGQSVGATGRRLARGAPSLWNVGFAHRLDWDGRASSLEAQLSGPLFGADEMGNTPAALLEALQGSREYPALFEQAFGARSVRLEDVLTALAAFEASLVSLNSRYDLYAHGVSDALSPVELQGLNVFRSFVARCAECHTPPLFTNQQIAVIGAGEPDGVPFDPGYERVTGERAARGGFKVPSLRNVALTAPYMHSGAFIELKDAVEFYNLGRGHAVPKGEQLQLHWHVWEPRLEARELDAVVSFLRALTDTSFLPATPSRVPSGLAVPTAAPSSAGKGAMQ